MDLHTAHSIYKEIIIRKFLKSLFNSYYLFMYYGIGSEANCKSFKTWIFLAILLVMIYDVQSYLKLTQHRFIYILIFGIAVYLSDSKLSWSFAQNKSTI